MHRRCAGFVIVGCLLATTPVSAQPGAAAAQEAFERAQQLRKEGKLAEACAAFAESDRLDPQFGAKYQLALCQEDLGRLASAQQLYRWLAINDTSAPRKAEADRRAAALEPRLSRLLIRYAEPVPGLRVTRDGTDVTVAVGTAEPVDPGDHEIVATAPGVSRWRMVVTVRGEGTTVTVTVPALQPIVVKKPPPPPAEDGRARRRTIGLSVGGGGIAIAGAGLVVGALSYRKWEAARAVCGGDTECDSDEDRRRADSLASSARLRGNIATALVGAGVVAAVVGGYLFVTGLPQEDRPAPVVQFTPELTPGGISVSAMGHF